MNYLRNAALQQAKTPFVFLSDIDFLPMYGLYEYLKKAASMMDISTEKKVGMRETKATKSVTMVSDTFVSVCFVWRLWCLHLRPSAIDWSFLSLCSSHAGFRPSAIGS